MKNEPNTYRHQPSTREYLIALANYPYFTNLLNPENKPYKQLFYWLR
ncbi:MAG: hypothetical protein PSX81_03715 [bacterium]|nr:hypothetical protein [bacterium]